MAKFIKPNFFRWLDTMRAEQEAETAYPALREQTQQRIDEQQRQLQLQREREQMLAQPGLTDTARAALTGQPAQPITRDLPPMPPEIAQRELAQLQAGQMAEQDIARGQLIDPYTTQRADAIARTQGPLYGMQALLGETAPETLLTRRSAEQALTRPTEAQTAQIKNFRFRESLPERDRNVFDSMFRRQQMFDIGGGGKALLTPQGQQQTLITPQQFGQHEGLSANEKADLTRRYGEQVALPALRSEADELSKIVDEALNHPGFNSAYGLSTLLPAIRGSQRADFETFMRQGQGSVFLQAYEKLKGGGQITEIEAQKAEQAIARISDSRQSPESARNAWMELRRIVKEGLQRREKSAKTSYGTEGARSTAPTVTTQKIGRYEVEVL